MASDASDPDEAPPPRSSAWLAISAGLGGLVAVAALGKINPMTDESLARWLVLGISWGACRHTYPLWGPIASSPPTRWGWASWPSR